MLSPKHVAALALLQNALNEGTGCCLFDEMAKIIHPDIINNFADAVQTFEEFHRPDRYIVDGHEFDHEESAFMGDGQYAPFVVFDTEAQDNLPGEYPTREEAQKIADEMNAKVGN